MFGPEDEDDNVDEYELPDDIQETMEDVAKDQDWLDEIRHDLFDCSMKLGTTYSIRGTT